jgi:hypothetical protein
MKHKLTIFLIIDFLLALLFVLMFKKFAINLKFHEIGGLVMLVGCVIHFVLHPTYIVNTTKKIFNKSPDGVSLGRKARFGYTINLLLIILVIAMLVNSIMISKIVFGFEPAPFLNDLHKTLAAIMLLLVAIHLGLHYKMIALKIKFPKVLSIIIMSCILSFGVYSLITSSYIKYLNAVFVSTEEESSLGHGEGKGRGLGLGKGSGVGEGEEGGEHGTGQSSIVWTDAGFTLLTYGSILYTLCFATHLVDESSKKKKKKK